MRKKKLTQQQRIETLEQALTKLYVIVQTNSDLIQNLSVLEDKLKTPKNSLKINK
mgnify:CR=1 FL=1|jgi:hypothetical protein